MLVCPKTSTQFLQTLTQGYLVTFVRIELFKNLLCESFCGIKLEIKPFVQNKSGKLAVIGYVLKENQSEMCYK